MYELVDKIFDILAAIEYWNAGYRSLAIYAIISMCFTISIFGFLGYLGRLLTERSCFSLLEFFVALLGFTGFLQVLEHWNWKFTDHLIWAKTCDSIVYVIGENIPQSVAQYYFLLKEWDRGETMSTTVLASSFLTLISLGRNLERFISTISKSNVGFGIRICMFVVSISDVLVHIGIWLIVLVDGDKWQIWTLFGLSWLIGETFIFELSSLKSNEYLKLLRTELAGCFSGNEMLAVICGLFMYSFISAFSCLSTFVWIIMIQREVLHGRIDSIWKRRLHILVIGRFMLYATIFFSWYINQDFIVERHQLLVAITFMTILVLWSSTLLYVLRTPLFTPNLTDPYISTHNRLVKAYRNTAGIDKLNGLGDWSIFQGSWKHTDSLANLQEFAQGKTRLVFQHCSAIGSKIIINWHMENFLFHLVWMQSKEQIDYQLKGVTLRGITRNGAVKEQHTRLLQTKNPQYIHLDFKEAVTELHIILLSMHCPFSPVTIIENIEVWGKTGSYSSTAVDKLREEEPEWGEIKKKQVIDDIFKLGVIEQVYTGDSNPYCIFDGSIQASDFNNMSWKLWEFKIGCGSPGKFLRVSWDGLSSGRRCYKFPLHYNIGDKRVGQVYDISAGREHLMKLEDIPYDIEILGFVIKLRGGNANAALNIESGGVGNDHLHFMIETPYLQGSVCELHVLFGETSSVSLDSQANSV